MSTMRRFTAVLATSVAAMSLAAVAGTASASASACGYWKSAGRAHYTHCATDTKVAVQVDRRWPYRGYEACFGPGDHNLGDSSMFVWAYYVGRTC